MHYGNVLEYPNSNFRLHVNNKSKPIRSTLILLRNSVTYYTYEYATKINIW